MVLLHYSLFFASFCNYNFFYTDITQKEKYEKYQNPCLNRLLHMTA